MSKNRDYTRYSKGPSEIKEQVTVEEPVESVEVVVEEIQTAEIEVETVMEQDAPIEEPKIEESKPIIGIVTDCARLNVREQPNSSSEVLGVITAETELIIIEEESTKDFYKICTSVGLEGYCMKRYVTIMP